MCSTSIRVALLSRQCRDFEVIFYVAPTLISFLFVFIYLFAHGSPISLFSPPPRMKKSEMKTIKGGGGGGEILPVPTFPPILDSPENAVTLSIILN